MCVLLGYKLLHPKQPLYGTLCYLGFMAFFLGRLYELSRLLLNLELYNTFELGFVGIVGAFSFWLSSNFSIKQKVNRKASKKDVIKCLVVSIIVFSLYFLIIKGTVNKLERMIDFIISIYAASNVYYYLRHLLLIKEDRTGFLRDLKMYNIFGICFSILIILLTVAFAYSINSLLLVMSILLSIDLLLMIITFKKGVKEWK
jgi:hypothetical protein